jgi:molybdate/tungstate transport system permease protein
MIAPVLLFERFQSFGLEYSLPVAGLVILISMLVFVILRTLSQERGKS